VLSNVHPLGILRPLVNVNRLDAAIRCPSASRSAMWRTS
jgi:hypothetical protein